MLLVYLNAKASEGSQATVYTMINVLKNR